MFENLNCSICEKPTREQWLLNLTRYNSMAPDRRRLSRKICPECATGFTKEICKLRKSGLAERPGG